MTDLITAARHLPDGLNVQREDDDGTGLARFSIVHAGTGHNICGPAANRCATHLDQAVRIVADTGIDWTRSGRDCGADPGMPVLHAKLLAELGLCFDPVSGYNQMCDGDLNPPRAARWRPRFWSVTVPTRYAPGHAWEPYPYGRTDCWYAVIYYPAGEVEPGEGPIWLVEPYPAARADGTDGQDPISTDGGAGVAVLRGDAAPRPRGADRDGDWIVEGRALSANAAYNVFVTTDKDLMAAWCEAAAIADALNNGTVKQLGLEPEHVDVLAAAARCELVVDSRHCDTYRHWQLRTPGGDPEFRPVPAQVVWDLLVGEERMIEPVTVTEIDHGTATMTRFGLTRAGARVLAEIRQQYSGPARCRVCGCTADRGCPPIGTGVGRTTSCSWAETDLCSMCPAGTAAS